MKKGQDGSAPPPLAPEAEAIPLTEPPVHRDPNEVKLRDMVVPFEANNLCKFVGTPVVPHAPLSEMVSHPPYKETRHMLCGLIDLLICFLANLIISPSLPIHLH
ncbi:hypothetical protein HAX54_020575 [Datura stramonium]|uniref:Uncharacterized protein n=1 Tax=Datura stramonium TaxID=4076 RepID=A0ABS8S2L6_DATST|nr:hypothetical protein [Datura stramonium]